MSRDPQEKTETGWQEGGNDRRVGHSFIHRRGAGILKEQCRNKYWPGERRVQVGRGRDKGTTTFTNLCTRRGRNIVTLKKPIPITGGISVAPLSQKRGGTDELFRGSSHPAVTSWHGHQRVVVGVCKVAVRIILQCHRCPNKLWNKRKGRRHHTSERRLTQVRQFWIVRGGGC